VVVAALTAVAQSVAAEWAVFDFAGLQFWRRDTGRLALLAVVAVAVVLLVIRSGMTRKAGRHHIVVPALLRSLPGSRLAWTRHLPLVLVLAALPPALLALADPYSSLTVENVTYPGRRISLMIDASDSMQTAFKATTLNTRNETQPAFSPPLPRPNGSCSFGRRAAIAT
jgi:hypothetical protein